MDYSSSLNATQKRNIGVIISTLTKKGYTNKYIQAGILAIVSKESSFIPKSEKSYSGTSNYRIKKIFSRTRNLSDSQLTNLKKDSTRFFNFVYDGIIGNGTNEGAKYRGRGFNQLTGKANYASINRYTSVDIVKHPELLNRIDVAAEALIGYYVRKFKRSSNKVKEYNMTSLHDAKTLKDAVGVIYHANTGWGKSKRHIINEPTGGYNKAIARVDSLFNYLGGSKKKV